MHGHFLFPLKLAFASPSAQPAHIGGRKPRLLGRGLAVWGWCQGALIPGVLAVLIRQGAGPALALALELQALALGCSLASTATSPWGRRAWLAYAPLALGAWILVNRSVP